MTVPRDFPRERARLLRKCTPTQRKWLRELQKNGFRTWKAGNALGLGEGTVSRWYRKAHIQDVLKLFAETADTELGISQMFVLSQYRAIAGASLKDLVDEHGSEIPLHMLDDQTALALSERTVDANGKVKYRFHPKGPALDALTNLKNLGVKRVELTGKDGAPLLPPTAQPNEIEVARRLAFLLARGEHALTKADTPVPG